MPATSNTDSQRACVPSLKLLIARLQRMQFGRKSEKLDREIRQLELQLDDEASCKTVIGVEIEMLRNVLTGPRR